MELFQSALEAGITKFLIAGTCFEYGESGEKFTKIPPDFEIIADSDLVSTDGIASKSEPVWGFQTHIEATQAFVDDHNLPVKDAKNSFKYGHNLLDKFILSLR